MGLEFDAQVGLLGQRGLTGAQMIEVTAAPTALQGNDGDWAFWKNGADTTLYSPKAAGVWPAGQSLRGPTGLNGPAPGHEWVATALRFRNPDGSWGTSTDLKGPLGPVGPAGYSGWAPVLVAQIVANPGTPPPAEIMVMKLIAWIGGSGPAPTDYVGQYVNATFDGFTASLAAAGDFSVASDLVALIGSPNGLATLDSNSKLTSSQLPTAVVGALQYQGVWNAATNTPTIPAASSSNKGQFYKVSVAGTTNIDGISDWQVGDWIISNGTTWDKVDNTDLVLSVAGLTGAITAAALRTALDLDPVWANWPSMPTVTFATPGDLAVTYNARGARYCRVRNIVHFALYMDVTLTFTTSAGGFHIATFPVAPVDNSGLGALLYSYKCPLTIRGEANVGPTYPAGITMLVGSLYANGFLYASAYGAGVAGGQAVLAPANFVSGNRYIIAASGSYEVAP